MAGFTYTRRRDLNLHLAIADEQKELTLYSWGSPSVFNTADPEIARKRTIALGQAPNEHVVTAITLSTLLDRYLKTNQEIDFLSVDVEGLDLQVLRSNDWAKYRPTLVVVESYGTGAASLTNGEVYTYMESKGYKLIAWVATSLIFRDARKQ
jgi:FkbM family methyltransferase